MKIYDYHQDDRTGYMFVKEKGEVWTDLYSYLERYGIRYEGINLSYETCVSANFLSHAKWNGIAASSCARVSYLVPLDDDDIKRRIKTGCVGEMIEDTCCDDIYEVE